MIIVESFIYELGEFTIRKQPLALNPAFATHLIFFAGKLVGRQLSVPSVSDCQWYRATNGVYASHEESHCHSGGYSVDLDAAYRLSGGDSTQRRLKRKPMYYRKKKLKEES